ARFKLYPKQGEPLWGHTTERTPQFVTSQAAHFYLSISVTSITYSSPSPPRSLGRRAHGDKPGDGNGGKGMTGCGEVVEVLVGMSLNTALPD
ncbi:unnamed protein product, partial [Gadus morhua 'NCC']